MIISVQVATDPDMDYPVAELWMENIMIAEVHQEDWPILKLTVYEAATAQPINLEQFVTALTQAREALAEKSAFDIPE